MKRWRLLINTRCKILEKFWRGIERATSLNKSSLTWRGGCSAPLKFPRLKYSHFEDFSVTLQQIWLHAKVATWTTFNWVPRKMLNNSCKAKVLSCLKLEFYERGNFTLFAWEEPRWIGCPGVLYGSVSLGMTSGRGYPLRSLPKPPSTEASFSYWVYAGRKCCEGMPMCCHSMWVCVLVYLHKSLWLANCFKCNDSQDFFHPDYYVYVLHIYLDIRERKTRTKWSLTLMNFLKSKTCSYAVVSYVEYGLP